MIDQVTLNYLLAIQAEGSISKAAESLNVTQSAVSQSIKNLENKLGLELLERSSKSVTLTQAGFKLTKLSKSFQKRFDDLMEQIQLEKGQMRGKLKVGSFSGIGKAWLGTKVVEFAAANPDTQIKFTMDFPESILKAFESHELDCLILPEHYIPTNAERHELQKEYTTLVFNKDLNFNSTVELKEIVEMPLIFFEENDPLFHRWCKERFHTIPKGIVPKLVINSFGHMLKAVYENLGVAVVPTHVLQKSFFKDKIGHLDSKSYVYNDHFYFVYHSEDKDNIKISNFFEYLSKTVSS